MDEGVAALIASSIAFVSSIAALYYSRRNLTLQLAAEYRTELAKRQIEACEAFWQIFENTSRTPGEHRIIRNFDKEPILDFNEVDRFIEKLETTFVSKAGLYLSEDVRRDLYAFREVLRDLMQDPKVIADNGKLLPEQKKQYYDARRSARQALRREVGSVNFTAARTQYEESLKYT